MNTPGPEFRTAAIGGFQKQDVIAYIEQMGRTQAEREAALRKELAAGEQALRAAEEQAVEAQERERALQAEVARLTEEREERARRLAQVEKAQAEGQERCRALEQELEQVRLRLERAEPLAEAYESVKDRTAGLELEAHCRAQTIQIEAEERVKQVRAGVEQWFYQVQAGYDRLRTDMDATISHACGELDRVRRSLEGISAEFDQHEAALDSLMQDNRALDGPLPPKPLRLDGE